MKVASRSRYLVLASLVGLSCGENRRAGRGDDQNAALGGDVAARVGGGAIPLAVVASVAEAQKVTAREAAKKVVDDEIAATAARSRGLDQRGTTAWRLVATRARFTSDRLYAEAKRRGLPTNAEVEKISERHWVEVDRPPSVRVVHAIVLRPKDAAMVVAARSLARELHDAVTAASNDEFESAAKAVPHEPKLQVKVERLPAFTGEGMVTEGPGRMDEVFSKTAFELRSAGDTSAVVETGFGFHVIRLLERIPAVRMPFETRRLAFAEEVYLLRAHELMTSRLEVLRGTNEIVVSPAAEQLMRAVKLTSDAAPAP
ncbi:MAG TPA: peptidyl-prolyl cis-trans isomerase [Labilithrix sp.]|nr:peptidyl-prolyl cis-trans isomerase [Labilithrix sp.]